jgi:hypothetical protein
MIVLVARLVDRKTLFNEPAKIPESSGFTHHSLLELCAALALVDLFCSIQQSLSQTASS